MAKTYNLFTKKSTRLYYYSLVLFLCAMLACQTRQSEKIRLIWKNGQATGILIPDNMVQDMDKYPLTVSLNGADKAILGSFSKSDTGLVFEPLIPLSQGMEYGVLQSNRVVGKINVPLNKGSAPQVIAVYPQTDTVPENLLKLYVQFSEPMQTGNALDHIFLLDKNRDTLDRIFLNLQPELWDSTDHVLTLWIDPGRIKRDLVLNKELGNPLHKQHAYELIIGSGWRDRRGLAVNQSFSKKFIAGGRDDTQPDIKRWRINPPAAGTAEVLNVTLDETLDHYLLQESISVLTSQNKTIDGKVVLADKDKLWQFTPTTNWTKGNYKLRIYARLEDLAGNNLNKVFDRDIYKQKRNDQPYYEVAFTIK